MTDQAVIPMVCTNPQCDSYGYELEIPAETSHGRVWADDVMEEVCDVCGEELESAEQ